MEYDFKLSDVLRKGPGVVRIRVSDSFLERGIELRALKALIDILPKDTRLTNVDRSAEHQMSYVYFESSQFPNFKDDYNAIELEVQFKVHVDGEITAQLSRPGKFGSDNGLDKASTRLYSRLDTDT